LRFISQILLNIVST